MRRGNTTAERQASNLPEGAPAPYLSLTRETVTQRAALAVSTSTLERTVDQDARRASRMEIRTYQPAKLIIESAQVLALGAGAAIAIGDLTSFASFDACVHKV